jgi:hypothetical protein
MHVLRLMLGGLLAVAFAVPVGFFVAYVAALYLYQRRFLGFGNIEGLADTAAFAILAFPVLLLALAAIRGVLVQHPLGPIFRLPLGAVGGAVVCWAIFSLYQAALLPTA